MYNITQWAGMYAAFLGSMITGASVVHYVLRPNLSFASVARVPKKELS